MRWPIVLLLCTCLAAEASFSSLDECQTDSGHCEGGHMGPHFQQCQLLSALGPDGRNMT